MGKNVIKLSVIIPCFNSGKFINKTLELLYSQKTNDIEVIVVNDGSTDNTLEIVNEFKIQYPDLIIINKENEGVSVARNVGIREAKGEFIYFFDSDDSLEKDTLPFYLSEIYSHPLTDLIINGYCSKSKDFLVKDYVAKRFDNTELSPFTLQKAYLQRRIPIHICSCLIKRQFLIDNELFFTKGLKIGEDIEFLLKCLKTTQSSYYSARKCFIYQIRTDSVMKGYKAYSKTQWNSFLVNYNTMFLFPDRVRKYTYFFMANSYLSNLVYYLKSDYKDNYINDQFKKYHFVLNRPIPFGNLFRFLIIQVSRLIPLSLLLYIKKGRCEK